MTLRHGDRLDDPVVKQHPVGQTGQKIVLGRVGDLLPRRTSRPGVAKNLTDQLGRKTDKQQGCSKRQPDDHHGVRTPFGKYPMEIQADRDDERITANPAIGVDPVNPSTGLGRTNCPSAFSLMSAGRDPPPIEVPMPLVPSGLSALKRARIRGRAPLSVITPCGPRSIDLWSVVSVLARKQDDQDAEEGPVLGLDRP